MTPNKIILVYALEKSIESRLAAVMRKLNITVISVGPEQYAESLETVLRCSALPGTKVFAWPEFAEPMIVMDGLTGDDVDKVLYAMRTNQIRIDLKAVVTPTNCTWTSLQLYNALCKERAEMTRQWKK